MQRSLMKVAIGILSLILLALMWRWLGSSGLLNIETLRALVTHVAQWRTAPWMVLAITLVYAGLLLVMFPLSLLVVVTGLVFGPAWGLLYATIGTLASSVVSYWAGHWLGRTALLHYGGRYLTGMAAYLSERGIRTMTIINLLPLAPFTLTNMMAGAFHLNFRDYMIGSALGIVPGLAVVILLGSQLGALFSAAQPEELLWALAGLATAIGLLFVLARLTRRFIRREGPAIPPMGPPTPSACEASGHDIPPAPQHRSRESSERSG
ncbi:TVP38/TMEM64 family protein [Allohahella sp. A8]|uniref:TVP38/TMEM64 family protein n=1 Tax=Allohahella sp. A8 TaxID=3141461 RepID=UPI000C0ABC23|nr:phospholipase [Hahellaceae bacterium]|tara:strand:- start:18983 stop:19777 length:795 start_codon:yes stop_codon:yes gene_type:complete